LRLEGTASGRTLKVMSKGFFATYEMAEDGSLKARFERSDIVSSATMAKADFASLTRPDAVVAWTRGKSEFLQTDLIEDGKPVRLEAVIFRPSGGGPLSTCRNRPRVHGEGRKPASVHPKPGSAPILLIS
jgi:hypothetical protein